MDRWIMTLVLNGHLHFYGADAVGDLTLWRGAPIDDMPLPVADARTCDPNLWAHLRTMADYTPWPASETEHLSIPPQV
jgi:hypothetical protein